MIKRFAILGLLALAGGCTSHIVPLRPVQKVEVWVPESPATAASTSPAATATATSTQPGDGHLTVKTIDPNRSARFIYNANYDNVWKQAMAILTQAGFAMDRQDYRLGVLTTHALPSAQFVEFWKPEHTEPINALENTVNNQRRWITLTISAVEGKPEFYEIAVQVLVERETNPGENLGGPIFVEGSGFGRNAITLRSDYATSQDDKSTWSTVGHDPDLERKLLDQLFKRI